MVGYCWASLFIKVSTGVNMKVPGCFYTYCVCVFVRRRGFVTRA